MKHRPIIKAVQNCVYQEISDPVEVLISKIGNYHRQEEAGGTHDDLCGVDEIGKSDGTNFIIVDRLDIVAELRSTVLVS